MLKQSIFRWRQKVKLSILIEDVFYFWAMFFFYFIKIKKLLVMTDYNYSLSVLWAGDLFAFYGDNGKKTFEKLTNAKYKIRKF
jgi:hypothetical protein